MSQDPPLPEDDSTTGHTSHELHEYGLGIRRRYHGDVVVFELRGMIGAHDYQSFMGLVRKEHLAGKRLFVFALSGITYVNSSGLGFLLSCARKFEKDEARLVLCELQPRLQTLFKVSGKLPLVVRETCDEAIQELLSG